MKFFLFIFTVLFSHSIFGQVISKIESVQSLYIEIFRDQQKLGSATGFIIKSNTQNYLVTNYHVVTNKNPINNQWLDTNRQISPNRILIAHNAKELGKYEIKQEFLLDKKGNQLWHQDKIGTEMVDVIELPLKDTSNITVYPVKYKNSFYDSVLLTPTDRIFILGFPLGFRSAPIMPIWKSGLIASEPDIDQDGKPIMWIDAITYPGMSGSPVYFMSNEMVSLKNGSSALIAGGSSMFVGVFAYSNQFNIYGALWKASFLKKIFDKLP